MKIAPSQYAQALYGATKEKSQAQIGEAVSSLIKILAKNSQIKESQKIISKFREIYNRENNIVEAEVTTREGIDDDLRKHLRKYVSNKYNAEKVEINNIIDKSIKGGIIIRVGDEVIDGSVVRQLKELKNKLI
jgi:F-type H+-transporting ATPase subunit delta